MKIISIINQKGGVSKTTTALAIAYGLAERNRRVLAIDLDAQGNFTDSVQLTAPASEDIYSLLLLPNQDAKTRIAKAGNIDIIPSNSQLVDIDIKLTDTGKEYRLREALEPLKTDYDYIIIDTPPALSVLTINALTTSDNIIIPAQADAYSLTGIQALLETVKAVQKYTNPGLKVDGILLTRYNGRAILSVTIRANLEAEAEKLGTKLFNTVIRECTAIKEAQLVKQPIYKYNRKSNATADYNAFLSEYLND